MANGPKEVGARIREAMERRHKRPGQLAKDLGQQPATISHWLYGRRACPAETLRTIATLLKVNYEWLAGDATQPSSTSKSEVAMAQAKARPQANDRSEALNWCFRDAPPDGGRDFGNANAFATPPDVPTLVRETGQNSSDATLRDGAVPGTVYFRLRLIELGKAEEAYVKFARASKLEELREHLRSASRGTARLSEKVREGLDRLDGTDPLYLLRVDDYGTIGLPGAELAVDADDDDSQRSSPYAALIRNNLDTSKQSANAGGSYGLGKAVLWNCSDLSTVLFASDIPGEGRGTRLVGRSELTWHKVDQRSYAGPGWFGVGDYGHSLYADPRDELLSDLQLDRSELPSGLAGSRTSGTSALILGFRDPESEGRFDTEELLGKLARGAAENFWPAILMGRMKILIEHVRDGVLLNQRIVDPREYVPEFCELLQRHLDERVEEELEGSGSVTRRVVPLRAPGTRDGVEGVEHYPAEMESRCHLLVRLDDDETQGSGRHLANTVAMVRGRYMVTQYWNREGVAMGASTFHALLLAGDAVSNEPAQLAAEQFLRLSEPPAHNDWKYEEALRTKFRPGARQRLKDFKDALTKTLRETVKRPTVEEDDGPEELRRLLHLGAGGDGQPPLATLRSIKSTFNGDRWEIKADVAFNEKKHALRLTPRVWIDVESGSPIRLPWHQLEYRSGATRGESQGSFEVGPNPRAVSFSGTTESRIDGIDPAKCRAKIDLLVEPVQAPEA